MGGGRAWVSGSLQPLSECGCSSRRRKTVPPSGCRVAVFPLPTPCAAGRLSIPVGARSPRGDAPPKSVGFYQILNKFAKFAKQLCSSSSPSAFVVLVGPRASSWHDIKGASSTGHRSVVDTHL